MVIARPAGLRDVGYQMIARPLVERLSAARGQVALDVLRPPTLEAMHEALGAAVIAARNGQARKDCCRWRTGSSRSTTCAAR